MKTSKRIFKYLSVAVLFCTVGLLLFACTDSDESGGGDPSCEHHFELQSSVPPTCIAEGYEEHVCTKCKKTERRVLEKTQHDPSGKLIASVPATCTEAGYEEYACAACGETMRVEQPMLGHTPGASATISTQQICTVCGSVIQERLDYTSYFGDELAINYYHGTADGFYRTAVDSRYHGTYDQTLEYRDKNGNSLPLSFSIPIQEFYTHELLSTADVTTKDGRTYTTTGGFEVSYTFRALSKLPQTLYAWDHGLGAQFSEGEHLLYVVGSYPVSEQSSYYNSIYEVVDFASAYIEISKKTADGYETLRRVSTPDDWRLALKNDSVTLTADNADPFMQPGTYRILLKYDMLWVTEASSPVYDDEGNYGCPWGWINSQYESFYVEVTDEKGAVLVPYDQEQKDGGYFFQLRAEISDKSSKFLPAYSTLQFGNENRFQISARLDFAEDVLHLDQKKVTEFSLQASVYDEESRSYRLVESFDLTEASDVSALAGGGEVSVTLPRDEALRNRIWRLDILLKTDAYTETARYYCLIKW